MNCLRGFHVNEAFLINLKLETSMLNPNGLISMNKLFALLAIFSLQAIAQQNPQAPAASSTEQLGGTKLSELDQQKLVKILQQVQEMRKQNRYTDAIAKLDEAEKIAPRNGLIHTLRGDVDLAGARAEDRPRAALPGARRRRQARAGLVARRRHVQRGRRLPPRG